MFDLFTHMRKYEVPANSIEDFLLRYTKPSRHEERGPEYVAARIKTYQEEMEKFRFVFITHHNSKSGETVSYYGERSDPHA